MVSTSMDAFKSILPTRPALRKAVYDVIYGRGENGATAEEVETALSMHRSTVSGRFSELRKDGDIVRLRKTRKTKSGRSAYVHVASRFASAA